MSIRLFCIAVVKAYVKLLYGHKVYGLENLTRDGGIIASNHSSFLDPPLIGISCPDEVHFLARSTLFNFPLFGWLIRKLNTHPIKRGKENASTFKLAVDLLKSGKKVVVFPEGGRSIDGNLRPGQLGVGMLVLRTECKVFPVYIDGAYEIYGVHRKWPKLKGHTCVVFGSPLDFKDLQTMEEKKQAQQLVIDRVMGSIAALKNWYSLGAKGTPP